MNHDANHCLDYTPKCPKKCYRAQLTEDLRKRVNYPLPTSWAHYKGTKECHLKPTGGRVKEDAGGLLRKRRTNKKKEKQ